MPGLQARAGLFTFLRYAGPGWQTLGSFSQSIHRAAYRDIPEGEEEFWIVEGEMRPIRGIQDRSLLKVIEKGSPPSVNANLTKKQVAAVRLKRVLASRLTQSEKGQETYWSTYFERYQDMRNQAEKLYWDGPPKSEAASEVVDRNDPFTILGLKRRDKPYSPVEIRSAYRTMALKYHPDHNPGKDAAAKFERVWNAYKMLQHKRSWR
ncbi:hypothetical protein MPTK1_2g23110 [Marchantia polymorpha subsp. ruderalis]|uniref:J domain-containing protein n=1 Tax=Marchantia polymorpha TaxID=3197 RepID=A0A2R6WN32_MARPO|nr:hypothetical protein MARPO_0072s0020 [Marchantia polymorpha]BBN03388.1 hypothetical protein Mp_2g23110 [Marchantia polymorpha subsp. ruderalis]|eukprot:PTQ35263.1 hypothetical protein MARPO_0072s0020 [Marchantia polymorpha]